MIQIPEDDPESQCFIKAKMKGEPTFTLRAQDETSGATVLAWIKGNFHNEQMSDDRLREAFEKALIMRNYANRPAD